VRETVQERWIDPAQLMKPSSKSYKDAHLAAVRNIADQFFAYPTPEYPHLRTFVNEPEVEQKIFTNLGRELAPDIVVLEWPEKLVSIVAEVATPDMLTQEMADQLWAVEANLADVVFYLYVPAGHAAEAKRLLKNANIKNVKLRTWRHITGLKTVDVAPLRV
jgi:hypothetical protein